MTGLMLYRQSRVIYEIRGDYKIHRYFTANGALRKLAFRKLAKKYPISKNEHPGAAERGEEQWLSDLSFETRLKIASRFARRYRKALRGAA